MEEDPIFPRVPVGDWAESIIDWLTTNVAAVFDFIDLTVGWLVETLNTALLSPPSIVIILVLTLIAWLVRSWQFAVATPIGFALVAGMGQWDNAMLTLSLVIIATIVAVIIAGRLQGEEWEKDGQKRQSISLVANDIMTRPRPEDGPSNGGRGHQGQAQGGYQGQPQGQQGQAGGWGAPQGGSQGDPWATAPSDIPPF